MRRFRSKTLARRVWHAFPSFVLAFGLTLSTAGPVAAQQDTAPDDAARAAPGGAAAAVEETLGKVDGLIAQLDARIAGTWARAEEVLALADAAADPDEQMRLEVLYGRMAALAQGLEAQRAKLRTMRDELAASAGRTAP